MHYVGIFAVLYSHMLACLQNSQVNGASLAGWSQAYSSQSLCLDFYQTSVSFDPFLYKSHGRDMKPYACFRDSLFSFCVMLSALFYLSHSKSKVIHFL